MEKGDKGLVMSDKKAAHHWGYLDTAAWDKEFEICGAGKMQSPVNIDPAMVEKTGSAKLIDQVKYSPLGGRHLKNNGHNCQVDADNLGYVQMPDGKYHVHQFHFHFPSEHEVDGQLAAGEMHIVHQKEGAERVDSLLVVGVMFDEGAENPFLKQLGFTAPMPLDDTNKPIAGKVDLVGAFGKQLKGDFYRYDGSLTTPPCAETVKWFVLAERATASKAQIDAFKALYPNPSNSRPVQQLHERHVRLDSLNSSAQSSTKLALSSLAAVAVALTAALRN